MSPIYGGLEEPRINMLCLCAQPLLVGGAMSDKDETKSESSLEPAHTLRDGHAKKKFPAGIASMVAILRQMRMESKRTGKGTFRENDSNELRRIRERVDRKFPGINASKRQKDDENREKAAADPDYKYRPQRYKIGNDYPQRLTRIESQDTPLEYVDLRVLSDWAGLSVAQFVMVSHALSTERRAYNEASPDRAVDTHPDQYAAVRSFLEENRKVLGAMEEILDEAEKAGRPAFYDVLKNHDQDYLGRFEVIKKCAEAANRPDPLDWEPQPEDG